jgi:hypothetical protein
MRPGAAAVLVSLSLLALGAGRPSTPLPDRARGDGGMRVGTEDGDAEDPALGRSRAGSAHRDRDGERAHGDHSPLNRGFPLNAPA